MPEGRYSVYPGGASGASRRPRRRPASAASRRRLLPAAGLAAAARPPPPADDPAPVRGGGRSGSGGGTPAPAEAAPRAVVLSALPGGGSGRSSSPERDWNGIRRVAPPAADPRPHRRPGAEVAAADDPTPPGGRAGGRAEPGRARRDADRAVPLRTACRAACRAACRSRWAGWPRPGRWAARHGRAGRRAGAPCARRPPTRARGPRRSAMNMAATISPQSAPNGMRPTAPPRTHATMSRVSEWANALARTCSSDALLDRGVDGELGEAAGDRGDQAQQGHRAQGVPVGGDDGHERGQGDADRLQQGRPVDAQPGADGGGQERADAERGGHDHDRHLLRQLPRAEADREHLLLDREREEQGQEPIQRAQGRAADQGADRRAGRRGSWRRGGWGAAERGGPARAGPSRRGAAAAAR